MFWGEINLFLHLILPLFSYRPNGGGRPYGSSPSCSRPPRCFEAWKTRPCRCETRQDRRKPNFPLQLWRHAWIYPRLGIFFNCKIVAILFPRKRPRAACRQFSGSNQLSCVPKASILCLFSWKKTKFFSRFHVAGAVGSFICDVTFRHQSHERSNLIFCCNIFTASS